MKLIRSLAFLLAVLCAAHVGLCADIYVNASSTSPVGNDTTGTGSAAAPYLTLGKASSVVASGDNVYLAGEFQGGSGATVLDIDGLSNVLIAQWSGMPQVWLKNSVTIVAGTAWTAATPPRYQATIPTGLSIQSISVSFGDPAMRDTYGRCKIHLQPSGDGATVGTQNTFNYNSGTGVVSVNINGASVDPDTFAFPVEYCLASTRTGGGNIITGENCTNCTVRGIKGRNYILTNETGYYVFMSGTGNAIEDCEFFNNGWHHAGFVASGASVPNVNNTIRRCTFWGGGDGNGTAPGTQTVFYSNGSNTTGAMIEDCVYHCYKMLDPANLDWGDAEMNGSYTHTDGAPNTVDLEHRRCQFYQYTSNRLGYGANSSKVPAENLNSQMTATNYGLRYYDCKFETRFTSGYVGNRGIFLPEAALVRCHIINMALKGDTTAGFGNSRAMAPELTAATHLQTLFESCHLVFDLAGGSGPSDAAGIRFLSGDGIGGSGSGRSTICFLNSAVINNNTAQNVTPYLLISSAANGTAVLRARGSVFCATTSGTLRQFVNDSGMPVANYDFKDCWYFGISTTLYSSVAAINTAAEWLASVDTTAIQAVDPGYYPAVLLEATSPRPVAGASVLIRTHNATKRSTLGINLARDSKRYGPWQTGGSTVGVPATTKRTYIFD